MPKRSKKDLHTERINVPLTPAQKRAIKAAAKRAGKKHVTWVREVALEAARKP